MRGFRPEIRIFSAEEFWREEAGDTHGGQEIFGGLEAVKDIVLDVAKRGDAALLDYTRKFDGVALTPEELVIPRGALEESRERLNEGLLTALETSYRRIYAFHEEERPRSWVKALPDGSLLGKVYRPVERVGVYIPGGRAAYPSSVLMTCIPARIAGVKEIIITTPPGKDGRVDDVVLAAASLVGASRVVRVGGPQAIAAMALGTESVPKVDKIVGPGGYYVTCAKRLVFGLVGIDMLAGPSEVAILADGSSKPEFVALDMISQAEHDPLARAILITPEEGLVQACQVIIAEKVAHVERREIVSQALEENGAFVLVRDLEEGIEFVNRLAPEHLSIQTRDPLGLLGRIGASGTILLGPFSPVALSDYTLGTNHVLPTGRSARFSSPLGVETFMVASSFAMCSEIGFGQIARAGMNIAEAEGLFGHSRALAARLSGSGEGEGK